jgi:hypothetical protein
MFTIDIPESQTFHSTAFGGRFDQAIAEPKMNGKSEKPPQNPPKQ